jgi:cell division protein FtsZ
MSGAGSALMGIGSARGDNRALLAAEQAIASPLLEASMEGAHGVLLSISGGSDLGLFEINEAASLVSDAAHPDANIIFGAVIDDALGDEVRVTVIAAGFDGGKPGQRKDAGTTTLSTAAPVAPAAPAVSTPAAPGASPRPAVPAQTGERLVTPPAAAAPSSTTTPRPGQPGSGPQSGGITVPPLPPIPGPGAGSRRPLASEDFEEELDIPEFLRSQ